MSPNVTVCASRVFAVNEHSLSRDGCCVRGLVKVTQLRVYYTSAHVPRVFITSGCDTLGRVALLAPLGAGIR